jgi:hypothetical protein
MWLSTSTFSILRGTTTDQFGDPKDTDQPVRTGIPGSVREIRSIVTTISEGRGQQVRFLVGRLQAGTDIQNGDRIRDEHTGQVYIIDAIDPTPQSPILDTGVRLDLRRVS